MCGHGLLRAATYLGDTVFEIFRVDVVVEQTMTADPESTLPIEPVEIAGLRSVPYRTYPIADQIADKHAAMIDIYAGQPSTRYRDLVDLVLIATTQTVDSGALNTALVSEHRRRGTAPTAELSLPSEDWHVGYRKLAVGVPGFRFIDAADALEIVNRLIGPVLGGLTAGTWDPETLEWTMIAKSDLARMQRRVTAKNSGLPVEVRDQLRIEPDVTDRAATSRYQTSRT